MNSHHHTARRASSWRWARSSLLLVVLCSCAQPEDEARVSPSTKMEIKVAAPVAVDLGQREDRVAKLLADVYDLAVVNSGSGAARGELGMAYEVNGFAEEALTSYAQAAVLATDDPRWPYFQSRQIAREGELQTALNLMDRVLSLDPEHIPALMWQGTWSLALGDTVVAEQAFRRAGALGLGWAAEASLAKVRLQQQRPEEALELLEELVKTSPFPSVYQLLGTAYGQAGQPARSRIALARGRNRQPIGWLDPWEELKKPYRQSYDDRLREAQIQIRRGDMTGAVRLLEDLQTERPDDPVLLTTLSNAYVLTGENQRGFWLLRRARERPSVHHSILVNLAAFYSARGDVETALQHLDEAISVHPGATQAYLRKARLLAGRGEWDLALASFNQALGLDVNDARPFVEAGDIVRRLRGPGSASQRYREAITVDASYLPGYLKLADCLAETNDHEGARDILETALLLEESVDAVEAATHRLDETSNPDG